MAVKTRIISESSISPHITDRREIVNKIQPNGNCASCLETEGGKIRYQSIRVHRSKTKQDFFSNSHWHLIQVTGSFKVQIGDCVFDDDVKPNFL